MEAELITEEPIIRAKGRPSNLWRAVTGVLHTKKELRKLQGRRDHPRWGGRREGSGPKPGNRRFQVRVTVPLEAAEAIWSIPGKKARNAYLNRAIELMLMMQPPTEVKEIPLGPRRHRERMDVLEKARDDVNRLLAVGKIPRQRKSSPRKKARGPKAAQAAETPKS